MIATIIGIVGGLIVIMIFTLLKQFDKPTMFGLILSGIGFLYVGISLSYKYELSAYENKTLLYCITSCIMCCIISV